MPSLVWLRSFEAAARLLNFTEAGRELGLTQTAVSLHIKALEETLQCRLFHRSPRNLALTDLGQAYAQAVRKGIGDVNLATISLFGSSTRQTITVRAPISTVTLWLAPRLPSFLEAFPNINIRLVSTIWAASVSNDDVDIDLQLGFPEQFEPGAERISSESIVPIAASGAASAIQSPGDLLAGSLIQILGYEDSWAKYLSAVGLDIAQSTMRLSVDTTAAALALVVGGGGYAVILSRFARHAVATGAPITIVGDPVAFPQSHFLARTARDPSPRAEVQLFADWLRTTFNEDTGGFGTSGSSGTA